MKNFTPVLSVILAIAVAVLFYLHFSQSNPTVKNGTTINSKDSNSSVKVAYFEMDSIENKYEYLKDVRIELRNSEQKKAAEINAMRNSGRDKLEGYQKRGEQMTEAEMKQAQEEMMRIDNEIKMKDQQSSQELQEESIKKLQEVKKTIEEYLKEFNKAKNYTYIVSSSSDIFYYKDTTYNITNEILKGLNEQYKKKKGNK